ncbi:hypothetical protein A7K94_0217930 [Modestobacter sp. VKM Ac-2676]|nr:hypothetical protein A7K94_0217930 [Modestobacter sp. VKM Ac-2676]
MELLRAVSDAEGVALLVVSHDLGVVAALCSDVVVLAGGRVVETGPIDRVLTDPVSREAHALVAAVPRLVLA